MVVTGRRTTLFIMDSDVAVPEPTFVRAKALRAAAAANGTVTAAAAAGPPVPRKKADPEWMRELTGLLRGWHRDDPQAAAAWAQEAISWLK
jgi:hypothetical protein